MTKTALLHRAPLFGLIIVVSIAFAFFFFLIARDGTITAQTPNYTSQAVETDDPLITKVVPIAELTRPTITEKDPVLGDKNAPVKLVIFSDFSCPHCATLAADVKKLITARTDVAAVWKDFPLSVLRPEAQSAHIAAQCAADQGKFWDYAERLFASRNAFSRTTFLKIAQELQLNPATFAACLEDQNVVLRIQTSIEEGNALRIDATPFVFIGDQRISGAPTFEELNRAVDIHRLIEEKQ